MEDKKIYQYQFSIPEEYSDLVVEHIADFMNLKFDLKKCKRAIECDDNKSIESVYIIKDEENKNRWILLDTYGDSYINGVVVRCDEIEYKKISSFLYLEKKKIESYEGIESNSEKMENVYNTEKCWYEQLLKRLEKNEL